MKIDKLLYQTPEMTEEKLLELINSNMKFLETYLLKRIEELHKTDILEYNMDISQCILKEWDIIQDKKSNLTKSQRDKVCALVSTCLIQMTKGDEIDGK